VEPSVKAFWSPKAGNTTEEYEDAFAYSKYHYAVADGATESAFPEEWAQGLVQQFVAYPPPADGNVAGLETWLTPLQRRWHAKVPWDRLPWFAEEKARRGAYAAFLGVRFYEMEPRFSVFNLFRKKNRELRWRAMALGDCCFFLVRHDLLVKAFPVEKAAQITSRPVLISSNPSKNHSAWKMLRVEDGVCVPGDQFFFMSDALAEWFMRTHEGGKMPWKVLNEITSQADYTKWLDSARERKEVRNDDSTFVVCSWK
jgi:hypothetical protein